MIEEVTLVQHEEQAVGTDDETAELRAEVQELRLRVEQLQRALISRVAIEQAKGLLAERFRLTPDHAFEVLRQAARDTRQPIARLAAVVTASRTTPSEVARALDGQRPGDHFRSRHDKPVRLTT